MARVVAILVCCAAAVMGADSSGVWKRTGTADFLVVKGGRGVRFTDGDPRAVGGGELGAVRVARNGRTLRLGGDKWERQDPLPREFGDLGFAQRSALQKASGNEAARLRLAVACAFNDIAGAEQAYASLSGGKSEARKSLAQLYWRNAMTKKALPYFGFINRFFFRQVAKFPEMKVTHRAAVRVQASRDENGHLLLPVKAAGKDSNYLMDTGGNKTLLSVSEARRLGLKLESPYIRLTNGITTFNSHLAILPVLEVGEMRLENVPVWVTADERLDWPGVLGIDVLLQWETVRWGADNQVDIGFPADEKDIGRANLCFRNMEVFAEAEAYGEKNLAFFLDTGTPYSEMYTRFAAQFIDLLGTGKRSPNPYVWDGLGGRREFQEVTVPQMLLAVAGDTITLRNKGVLLERRPGQNERHGIIGMDVLNSSARVTLDFRAMRIKFE